MTAYHRQSVSSGSQYRTGSGYSRSRQASSEDSRTYIDALDPDNVVDWDELDIDINLKQVFQEVGLQPNQGARLVKTCCIRTEEELSQVTLSDLGGLGLKKLAERRFALLLQNLNGNGTGVARKPEDSTKALNQLVTAGEKQNLQQVRDIIRSHHGAMVGVQQQACVTVRTMVAKYPTLRVKAGELGLLSDMQQAMRNFPDSAGIQKQALGAVWNMAAGNSSNQDIAGRIGLFVDVQTAMRNFEDHAEVQKMACGALWQLSLGHPPNKSRAGKQGMLESLQTAMQRHPKNVDVQREACGAIRSLTSDNANNKRIAGKIELMAELQVAMHHHQSNAEILKETCGAAWITIAGSKDNRQWAGDHGLLLDLQRIMRRYPGHTELQKQVAFAVMHVVAYELGNKVQAGEIGLLEDIATSLKALRDEEALVGGCTAASYVCHHCQENKVIAKQCGLLKEVERIQTIAQSAELARATAYAIKHMKLYVRIPKKDEISVELPTRQEMADTTLSPSPRRVIGMLTARNKMLKAIRIVNVVSRMSLAVGSPNTSSDAQPDAQLAEDAD